MFETYATGQYSVAEISRMIRSWGLIGTRNKPIATSKVHDLLANPFYIGLFRFNGEVHEGRHPAMISADLFKRVQEVRRSRARQKVQPAKVGKPLLGLLKCQECGGAVTAEKQKGHHYYRCTKKVGPCGIDRYIREEQLGLRVREVICRLTISQEWGKGWDGLLDQWQNEERAKLGQLIDQQRARLAGIQTRLDRLLDLVIDGTIAKEEYAA
ncbi:MAG: recombinase family protein, partial [Pseudomonadota bacterium]